jgi:hypothetical protein
MSVEKRWRPVTKKTYQIGIWAKIKTNQQEVKEAAITSMQCELEEAIRSVLASVKPVDTKISQLEQWVSRKVAVFQ